MTTQDPFPMGKLADQAGPPRLILHVGAPKCGSSSLQTALSIRPEFTNAHGVRMSYLCADTKGCRTGDAVHAVAQRAPHAYDSTADIRAMEEAEAITARLEAAAAPLIAEGTVPIISSEGWMRRSRNVTRTGLLERLGGGTHVVLFVRPPLDWLNAGWWQWGIWSDAGQDLYLSKAVPTVRWPRLAQEWANVPGVDAVHVRLADRDVVGTFFDLIEARAPDSDSVNTSLPPALMAYLLRNRDLRPDAHASAIEFQLSRALEGTPAPPREAPLWALTPEEAERRWAEVKFRAGRLAPLLPPEDRARLRRDPRWHGTKPYADRQPTDLMAFESPDRLLTLHNWLAQAAAKPAVTTPFATTRAADAAIREHVDLLTRQPPKAVSVLRARLFPK